MRKISVQRICKKFADTAVLDDVSFDVKDGELMTIVGSSGSGKSTLLRVIAGLEVADSGVVEIDGKGVDHVEPNARDLAMVFQSHALYPHLTVKENMSIPLLMRRLTSLQRLPFLGDLISGTRSTKEQITNDVRAVGALLGLDDYMDRRPAQLSGGQRQRVAIGRAIVRHPRAFLMDEPLSSLDPALRLQLRSEILNLRRRLNATIIYVTHDRSEALTMSDRIAVMMNGRILQIGPPSELIAKPNHSVVAEFAAETAPIRFIGTVRADGAIDSKIGVVPAFVALPPGAEVVILIDPKAWKVSEARSAETSMATVRLVDRTGITPTAHLELPDQPSLVALHGSQCDGMVEGNIEQIVPLWTHVHLFDRSGFRIPSRTITSTGVK